MARTSDVSEALAALQARWGAAAPRRGSELTGMVEGALARAPLPLEEPAGEEASTRAPVPAPAPFTPATRTRPGVPAVDLDGRIVSTGFAALDAVLGTGGLPRSATVVLRGGVSSGKTTVALRAVAEAQAGGAIVAWLDLARAFDPVEAVARGINPEWLVVLTPADIEEALALAGSLLAARTVDLLVLDLPDGRDPAVAGKRVGDRLGRLAALARRAGTLVVVLEPVALGRTLAAAVEEASGLRLELRRSGWIRLGRDVVGQRSEATVARNRYGPPGRRADLEILYAEGGPRDACLRRPGLLDGLIAPAAPPGLAVASPLSRDLKGPPPSADTHAPSAPALASPAPPPGEGPPGDAPGESHLSGGRHHLRLLASRPDHPRRTALDGRNGGGRGSVRTGTRRPAGDPARDRPPAGARGNLPRPRA
ncbi:MAG: DNA recombination/repair protein RecA [Chloroflexi bacterium]|nr:DNA recombination/repair protein RecA [Chloroflexota bacterium]